MLPIKSPYTCGSQKHNLGFNEDFDYFFFNRGREKLYVHFNIYFLTYSFMHDTLCVLYTFLKISLLC